MQINRLDDSYERFYQNIERDLNPKFNLLGKYGTKYKYLNPIDSHLKILDDLSDMLIEEPKTEIFYSQKVIEEEDN